MTTPTTSGGRPADARSLPSAAPASAGVPAQADAVHEVTLIDGSFAHAECTCGWRTAGRRDRRALRREARDHALLYADPAQLGTPGDH